MKNWDNMQVATKPDKLLMTYDPVVLAIVLLVKMLPLQYKTQPAAGRLFLSSSLLGLTCIGCMCKGYLF
jgi:hypothetical protein